jgi:hypothetical protein
MRAPRDIQAEDFPPYPWKPPVETSSSHVLSLRAEALKTFGDSKLLIAVFTPEGICAGVSYIRDADENTALVAFGDDPLTETREGFTDGQGFLFKAWLPDENILLSLDAEFLDNPSAVFHQNELDVITGLSEMTGLSPDPGKKGIRLFPNPFEDTFCIYQDGGLVKADNLVLFNSHGQLIEELDNPPACISFSGLSPGVYLVEVLFENTSYHAKLIKK